MPSTLEEALPLNGVHDKVGHQNGRIALGATAAALVLMTLFCIPQVVPVWHDIYFSYTEIEERGWTWLGVTALWLALALFWTLFHIDNGPCVATACLLCSFLWAYIEVILISQWWRDQLHLLAIVDIVAIAVLFALSARAGWGGVASPSHSTRSDGSDTWRRVFRKWVLVATSVQLVVAFDGCWRGGLPFARPMADMEKAPWEFNTAVLFTITLAVVWAAFLSRGGLVDETKRSACAWCAIIFASAFVLCLFSWPALGLDGHSMTTSVVLAVDVCVLAAAAAV